MKSLRAIAEAATQGRWHIGHVSEIDESCDIDSERGHIAEVQMQIDQRFILAFQPQTVIRLLDQIKRLEEEICILKDSGAK